MNGYAIVILMALIAAFILGMATGYIIGDYHRLKQYLKPQKN